MESPDTNATAASIAPNVDGTPVAEPARELTPAARRALQEAEARRASRAAVDKAAAELGGREGPDPVRYGDWENGGIASDF